MDVTIKVVDEKSVYFSHPMAHYNSDLEWECIEIIIGMLTPVGEDPTEGMISIMNPNQRWLSRLYLARKNAGDEDPFEIFREIARSCDIVVGVSFLDGCIGAGVAEECETALEDGKDVYLIFFNEGRKLFLPLSSLDPYEVLSREDTRSRTERGFM